MTPLADPSQTAPADPVPRAGGEPRFVSVWQAPLVPIALAATAGIVLDRFQTVPVAVSLTVALAALVAWAMARLGSKRGLDVVYLGLCCLALGAAYTPISIANDGRILTQNDGHLFVVGEIVDAEALTWKPGSGSATPLRFRIL